MTSVSIIIPAWNEAKVLKAAVQALLETDYDKRKCEVMVVAGGVDNTYEIAQELSKIMGMFSRYLVILQEPRGKNAALQQGIKEAKNDIVVLLDADTTVSRHWLKGMVGPIEQDRCDLTIANPDPVRKNWISDYYMITKAYFLDSITTFSGHSMAFKASLVQSRLEYFFDENTKVGVDYLLAKRLLEQGRKIEFVKEAHVVTHLPSSVKYFVLTELRWLTALINIEGVNYKAFTCNATVVAALILAIPLCETLFMLSMLFNVAYICKRVRMFLIGAQKYHTTKKRLLGFIILSYAYHVVGLIAYIMYFLGLSKNGYLKQGER